MIKMIDDIYDEFLDIHTQIEDIDSKNDRDIFINYAPTAYAALELLFTKYPFGDNDHMVDFGCGKGRVLIMAAYHSCKNITGYEVNSELYRVLLDNINNFTDKFHNDSIFSTFNINVEKINIDDTINKFFFFNPFHLKVYIKVLNAIQVSLQRNKRDIYIFLHCPLESTIKYINYIDNYKVESESTHEFYYAKNHKIANRKGFIVYANKQ